MKLNKKLSCKAQYFFASLSCPNCFSFERNNDEKGETQSCEFNIRLNPDAGKLVVE